MAGRSHGESDESDEMDEPTKMVTTHVGNRSLYLQAPAAARKQGEDDESDGAEENSSRQQGEEVSVPFWPISLLW